MAPALAGLQQEGKEGQILEGKGGGISTWRMLRGRMEGGSHFIGSLIWDYPVRASLTMTRQDPQSGFLGSLRASIILTRRLKMTQVK